MELDNFLGGKSGGSEWHGEPHVLTVHAVTPPVSQFDDGELDYDLAHPPSCPQEVSGYGEHEGTVYTCDVACAEGDVGLAFALRYSGTPVTGPGTYRIQGWGRTMYYHEYGAYEYDGGVGIMDDEPEEAAAGLLE